MWPKNFPGGSKMAPKHHSKSVQSPNTYFNMALPKQEARILPVFRDISYGTFKYRIINDVKLSWHVSRFSRGIRLQTIWNVMKTSVKIDFRNRNFQDINHVCQTLQSDILQEHANKISGFYITLSYFMNQIGLFWID
jgi:hypothetical protein